MKVIIAGGGSAGHVNPALSIAKKIRSEQPESRILFIGSRKGMERDLVPRAGFDIKFIDIEGFKRPFGVQSIKTFFVMLKGYRQASKIVRQFKPDLAIGTGGFVSGPAIRAASIYGAKTMLHEQNAYPGLANKMLLKRVDTAMVSFQSALQAFSASKKVVLTGNLIDESFAQMAGYSPSISKKTVVIIGGSQGAMTINNAVIEMINQNMLSTDFVLMFATGKRHYQEVMGKVKKSMANVIISDYIYDRDQTYQKADLMVIRGGAVSIAEVTAMGKPCIIIPSPFVPDNAQVKNAQQIADEGACEILLDNDALNGQTLYDKIIGMLNDRDKLMEMSEKSYALGVRDANERVYDEIMEVLS